MKIIKNLGDLSIVSQAIKDGGLVIFPTETIYGIGTNAFNEEAIQKIYEIKNRPEKKPLIVLVSDYEMLNSIVEVSNELEKKLMTSFWPGPLTIIFKKRQDSNIPDIVTSGGDTLAVRMIDNKIVTELIQKSGVPLVSPSANLSGANNANKIEEIKRDLGDKVDFIIDNGDILDNTPSTIVRVVNNKLEILREGKIKKEELLKVIPIQEKDIML